MSATGGPRMSVGLFDRLARASSSLLNMMAGRWSAIQPRSSIGQLDTHRAARSSGVGWADPYRLDRPAAMPTGSYIRGGHSQKLRPQSRFGREPRHVREAREAAVRANLLLGDELLGEAAPPRGMLTLAAPPPVAGPGLVRSMREVQVMPGQVIVRAQGTTGAGGALYLVEQGEVEVRTAGAEHHQGRKAVSGFGGPDDPVSGSRLVATLGRGSVFGDHRVLAQLYSLPRSTLVVVPRHGAPVILWALPPRAFQKLAPALMRRRKKLEEMLCAVPLLSDRFVTPTERAFLGDRMRREDLMPGRAVMRKATRRTRCTWWSPGGRWRTPRAGITMSDWWGTSGAARTSVSWLCFGRCSGPPR